MRIVAVVECLVEYELLSISFSGTHLVTTSERTQPIRIKIIGVQLAFISLALRGCLHVIAN